MSYGDPDPEKEIDDPQEQEAIKKTEETGEIDPSGNWPEGDEDIRTPV